MLNNLDELVQWAKVGGPTYTYAKLRQEYSDFPFTKNQWERLVRLRRKQPNPAGWGATELAHFIREIPEAPEWPRVFKSLLPIEKERFQELYNSKTSEVVKYREILKEFGIQKRTAQQWAKDLGLTAAFTPEEIAAKGRRLAPEKRTFLFTCAQNATKIHQGLWANIKAYANYRNAEIHVIPFRYKNPTSTFREVTQDFWAEELQPYLDLNRHEVCENLLAACDVKIQPTAVEPLNGLHAIAKGRSLVIGHPKMHMRTEAVLPGQHKPVWWTTGTVTVENYTDSRAGKVGESHHQLGFIVVEIDGDSFHVRHVPATKSGDFQDLNVLCENGNVTTNASIVGVRLGDAHPGEHDPAKLKATKRLIQALKPAHIILDDIFNGHSLSPWERDNPFRQYHRWKAGNGDIAKEVQEMCLFVKDFLDTAPWADVAIVRSNHDIWLERYVKDMNWKRDVHNAPFYAKCMALMLQNEGIMLVPYLLQEFLRSTRLKCLSRNDTYIVGGYNNGNHGDLGANGAKGSPKQYSRLPGKQVTNHTHAPMRLDGALVAGTSTVYDPHYVQGPSSWRQGDVVMYSNGEAANILFDERHRFTTLDIS